MAGCCFSAAAGHPQALKGVIFALKVLSPLDHDRSGDSGTDSDQREEKAQELQSGAGHAFQETIQKFGKVGDSVQMMPN